MLIVVDVETNGSCAGLYSMIELAAISVPTNPNKESKTFYTTLAPLPDATFENEALAITGRKHEDTLSFTDPREAMVLFDSWLSSLQVPLKDRFTSDNVGFDWQFVNHYFIRFLGYNPFGFRQIAVPCNYTGMRKDINKRHHWKKWIKTPHDHNPINDCMGVVEALREMQKRGLTW